MSRGEYAILIVGVLLVGADLLWVANKVDDFVRYSVLFGAGFAVVYAVVYRPDPWLPFVWVAMLLAAIGIAGMTGTMLAFAATMAPLTLVAVGALELTSVLSMVAAAGMVTVLLALADRPYDEADL